MTDVRETQAYQIVLNEGQEVVRDTQSYHFVLAKVAAADVRETQAYQFVLAEVQDADVRETQAYQFVLNQGQQVTRDTLTYFYVLGHISGALKEECAFLSYIEPGPMALAAPIGAEALAFSTTFGPIGEIL